MVETCYDENYPYHMYDRGDLYVVDDLAESNFAYAEEITEDSSERFEVRQSAYTLGRFETLEDAKEFLEGVI